ncbi:MAG: glucose-6-phosphate dehydrogenase [Streptosporangiaceae bacterium]
MNEIPVEVALHIRAQHAEGPAWDGPTARLWWVDITGQRVHCFDPRSGSDISWSTAGQPGGVVLTAAGDPVVAAPEGLAMLDRSTGQLDLRVPVEPDRTENRANDVKVDSRGRAWLGTMAMDKRTGSGSLYRIQDRHVTPVVEGLTIPNGPALDEARGRLYLADTGIGAVDVFDLDVATGTLAGRRRLLDFADDGLWPDGMTVDDEGTLWIALGRAGAVHRYRPDGTLIQVVEIPTSNPTSVAFGGDGGADLYIVTSWTDLPADRRAADPLAGAIFRCRPGVTGRPSPRFAVALLPLPGRDMSSACYPRERQALMIERMVLFGASGDLTSRLLMPAVAQLAEAGLLPPGLTILGAASTDWSTDEFRQHIASGLEKHSAAAAHARDTVIRMLSFQPADVTRPDEVRQLIGTDHPDTLVYLALPPFLLESVLPALAAAGLRTSDALAIEKPFGTDLASARHLNEILRIQLPAPTVFRIDHFLSDELVRRVLVLRFLNRIFEPTLNAGHVDHVDISWLESLTLEGRAGYYDNTGALKDMVQNHLMEAMALVLMEQPARLDAASFRDVRVEGLRAVATPTAERIARDTARARYTEGTIGTRQVPSYVDEPGVDPGRGTETHAAITLEVDNPRWAGVPFTLRSGKALPADAAEIAVHFRALPGYLLDQWPGVEPNVLRIGLSDPYVRLATTLNGPERTADVRLLEARSTPPRFTAYAHLILDMLRGDPMLFIRGDEAEESWRIIDPIINAWSSGDVPMQDYPAGQVAPGPAL